MHVARIMPALAIIAWLAHEDGFSQSPDQVEIVASAANLRTGPGTTFPVVGTLPRTTYLVVVDRDGEWFRVRIGPEHRLPAELAYVHASTVRFHAGELAALPEPAPSPPRVENEQVQAPTPAIRSGQRVQIVNEGATLHASPDSDSRVVRVLTIGQDATVLEMRGEWARVAIGSRHGYVHVSLVEPIVSPVAGGAKNRGTAMWLAIIPGAGHLYAGETGKGLVLAGIGAVGAMWYSEGMSDPLGAGSRASLGGALFFLAAGYGFIDAPKAADRTNARRGFAMTIRPEADRLAIAVRMTTMPRLSGKRAATPHASASSQRSPDQVR